MPANAARGGAGWSTEPIAWNATALNGRIAFKAQRAVFAPGWWRSICPEWRG